MRPFRRLCLLTPLLLLPWAPEVRAQRNAVPLQEPVSVLGHSVPGEGDYPPPLRGHSLPCVPGAPETTRRYGGLAYSDVVPLYNCDETLRCAAPISEESPPYGIAGLLGYDSFRGISDGGWQNNGVHAGLNYGTKLGAFSDWSGIGAQIGGTFGVYNWSGSDYRIAHRTETTHQGFLTYGFFRKATADSPFSAGIVQDWMFNRNFGVFAEDPTLSQIRTQVGYATSACNEFGVWSNWRVLDSTRNVPGFGPTTWRPVNHVSLFWHHKWFAGGPDTWLSLGLPEKDRLTGSGSLGDFLASTTTVCPLSDAVALYASITYMHPSASAGDRGAPEDQWNFTIGISIYPGRNARSRTIAGQRWMPLLPVAGNGTFLVDASNWY